MRAQSMRRWNILLPLVARAKVGEHFRFESQEQAVEWKIYCAGNEKAKILPLQIKQEFSDIAAQLHCGPTKYRDHADTLPVFCSAIWLRNRKNFKTGGKFMACIHDINLGPSEVIAILAMLVSGLSALYTRWSWREAKKANQISLLDSRREIYDAFFDLKMHMMQKAEFAEQAEVSKFYYHSRNSKINLPVALANNIEKYFDACFWIADIHLKERGVTKESREECKPHLNVEKELAPIIDKDFRKLLQEITT